MRLVRIYGAAKQSLRYMVMLLLSKRVLVLVPAGKTWYLPLRNKRQVLPVFAVRVSAFFCLSE